MIEGPTPVRVVITKRGMTCPSCGVGCYMLVYNEGWRCRECCGLQYKSRSHPHPMMALRSTLHRLGRADPGSLREQKLQRKLEHINSKLPEQARRVGFRCTRPIR